MTRSIEIEIKFEVLDSEKLPLFLHQWEPAGTKRIVDVYWDRPDGQLFTRGIFIRVRDGRKLDIKFNEADLGKTLDEAIEHSSCEEVSELLPLSTAGLGKINEALERLGMEGMASDSLGDYMSRTGLVESLVIDKRRQSFRTDEFTIDVDQVRGLGDFLEIEKMTDEQEDQAAVLARMKTMVAGLPLRHVDVGYNELYWRTHNFPLYLKGKYLLDEDRRKYRPHSLPKP